jgi:hypothetical protein
MIPVSRSHTAAGVQAPIGVGERQPDRGRRNVDLPLVDVEILQL